MKKTREILTHRAQIQSPDIVKARHFHDLFVMAIISAGGSLKITKEAWIESVKYDEIVRNTAPDGNYIFTVKKKEE